MFLPYIIYYLFIILFTTVYSHSIILILGIWSKTCITKKYRNVYVYSTIVPSSIYIYRHIPCKNASTKNTPYPRPSQ